MLRRQVARPRLSWSDRALFAGLRGGVTRHRDVKKSHRRSLHAVDRGRRRLVARDGAEFALGCRAAIGPGGLRRGAHRAAPADRPRHPDARCGVAECVLDLDGERIGEGRAGATTLVLPGNRAHGIGRPGGRRCGEPRRQDQAAGAMDPGLDHPVAGDGAEHPAGGGTPAAVGGSLVGRDHGTGIIDDDGELDRQVVDRLPLRVDNLDHQRVGQGLPHDPLLRISRDQPDCRRWLLDVHRRTVVGTRDRAGGEDCDQPDRGLKRVGGAEIRHRPGDSHFWCAIWVCRARATGVCNASTSVGHRMLTRGNDSSPFAMREVPTVMREAWMSRAVPQSAARYATPLAREESNRQATADGCGEGRDNQSHANN